MKTKFALAAVLLAAACGGGKSDVDAQLSRTDARDQIDGVITTTCAAETAYGDLTLPPEQMSAFADRGCQVSAGDTTACASGQTGVPSTTPNDDLLTFVAQPGTGDGDFGDVVEIQLYAGFGAFMDGGVVAGTYPLTGPEANYSSCGLCALIFADTAMDAMGNPDLSLFDQNRTYFQSGGSITLDNVPQLGDPEPHTLSGSISNVTFDHVNIDMSNYDSTPVGDCTTSITSLAFTADITEDTTAMGFAPVHIKFNVPNSHRARH